MDKRNPSAAILINEKIDYNEIIDMLKEDWEFECKFEILEQSNPASYSFTYEDVTFVLSEFYNKSPEDFTDFIKESRFANHDDALEFYENHTGFWLVSTSEPEIEDINKVYTLFTRVVMSILNAYEEALVYDIESKLVIESEVYLKMYCHMKDDFDNHKSVFPIDWYVNILLYHDEDGLSAFTKGFSVFNDYEIEILNKQMEYTDLYKIMKFIVTNVIARRDKITNGDTIPVPIDGEYDEAIVKLTHSEMLKKDVLAIIF